MRTMKLVGIMALALAVATTASAQRVRQGVGAGSGPLVDVSQVVEVDGTVVQLVVGVGLGMPELQVVDTAGVAHSFVLGPIRYLTEQGFKADVGDAVEVIAYVCTACDTGLAVASVTNVTKGLTLALRDEAGMPLWNSRPAAGGNGGTGGGAEACDVLALDLTLTTTYAATVVSYTYAAGTGAATLVASTNAGEIAFLASPARVLARAEFAPEAGAALDITAAPATVDGQRTWVVLVINDVATGAMIILRDPATGLPVEHGIRRGRL